MSVANPPPPLGADDPAATSEPVRRRVARGGTMMLGRHAAVALGSLAGSTILIRSVPAAAWAAYSVAYFLIVFLDNTLGATILGSLVRSKAAPSSGALKSAVALMHAVGAILALLFLGIAILGAGIFNMSRDFASCLGAVGVCGFVYTTRSVSVALLERDLHYRTVAAAEVVDQLTFYVVAIPLIASGMRHNADGLAVALAARGVVAAALLRRSRPVALFGAWRRADIRGILAFALPATGAAALNGITGLVSAIALLGHSSTALAYVMTASTIAGYAATGQVILQRVAFPGLAQLHGDLARMSAAARDLLRLTDLILLACVLPLGVLSPAWMALLFGHPWKTAAQALVAVGAGLLFWNVVIVFFAVLNALGHPRAVMWTQLHATVLYLGLAFALVRVSTVLGPPLAYALSRLLAVPLAAVLVRRAGCRVSLSQELIALVAGSAAMAIGAYCVAHHLFLLLIPVMGVFFLWLAARRGELRDVAFMILPTRAGGSIGGGKYALGERFAQPESQADQAGGSMPQTAHEQSRP